MSRLIRRRPATRYNPSYIRSSIVIVSFLRMMHQSFIRAATRIVLEERPSDNSAVP